jgi:formylglycine-generating enzyme required for sulfatase activity
MMVKALHTKSKSTVLPLARYPVTQAQYQAVMGNNPSHFKNNPQNPVEQVSWNDAANLFVRN